ncbi:MAG: AAA family ATPase, partial [Methylobacterium sp.]
MTIETLPAHDDLDDVSPPSATLRLRGRVVEWAELDGAFRSGRMHHAWLLQGPRGIGKASTAFAFARRVLGAQPLAETGDSAFEEADPTVRQIAQGSHPNLLHLDRPPVDRGEGFRTQITVDEIRRLNQFFRATAGGGWRVAIVDPADDLNRSAANALLKTLEEPPERSIFLIVNHMPGRLLPTIRSRCRVLRFAPLADQVV